MTDAEYHSSGEFTLDPTLALDKLEQLQAAGALEATLASIRGFILSGAREICVYSPGGHTLVQGAFEASDVLSGGCSLLDRRGWATPLTGPWPAILLDSISAGLQDIGRALWMSREQRRSLEWSQRGKVGGHLEYRGAARPTPSSSRAVPSADGTIQIRFRVSRPAEPALSSQVKEACRFSPVPVHYENRPFEPEGSEDEDILPLLPELALPEGCLLAEGTEYLPSAAVGRLLRGSPVPATVEIAGPGSSSPTRMLLRSWMGSAGPFLAGHIPLGTMIVKLLPGGSAKTGKLVVVRGGVIVETLKRPLWGSTVLCSDDGLNLDLGAAKVIRDKYLEQRIGHARAKIGLLAQRCLGCVDAARFWQEDTSPPPLLQLLGSVFAPRTTPRYKVLEHPGKVAAHRHALRTRLQSIGAAR